MHPHLGLPLLAQALLLAIPAEHSIAEVREEKEPCHEA
jgi:hypothetical protein